MKNLKNSLAIVTLLSLGACGGGGGSTSQPEATTLSGVAIDGYLYRAEVCLDLNDNFRCDPNEPSAITDDRGRYTLTGVTQAQISAHSVLVNAIAGVTIDQDQPGNPITFDYLLTAPAGSDVITPLTTLIRAEMITNSVDVETATANTFNRLFANANNSWKSFLNFRDL